MKRVTVIFLLVAFTTLASGALHRIHAHVHHSEWSAGHLPHSEHESERPSPASPHDDSNCFILAQLKLPILSMRFVPPVLMEGRTQEVLRATPVQIPLTRLIDPFDSRGPPLS